MPRIVKNSRKKSYPRKKSAFVAGEAGSDFMKPMSTHTREEFDRIKVQVRDLTAEISSLRVDLAAMADFACAGARIDKTITSLGPAEQHHFARIMMRVAAHRLDCNYRCGDQRPEGE